MSEEQELETTEEDLDTSGEEHEEEASGEEQEYSEIELEAMEHGWNPEGVDGKRHLSAEEFMDRQKFYDDIRALKRENKATREQLEALKKHQSKVREMERDKLLKELKAKKKLAYESEDYDSVVEIDEEIDKVRAEPLEEEEAPPVDTSAFDEWVENNRWYNTNSEMREEADTLGHAYAARLQAKGEAVDPRKVFEYVEKRIKKMYPEQFENTTRRKPASVEGAKRSSGGKKPKYSEKDLPAEDREIMNTLVKGGTMSKEEYLKSYFGE